ncbi:MAG: adaptor protein MecA [Oscillospiraceae bacterium]|nr:adaptor protein MecA [Oscillospiraceae bacterium]
MKIEKITDNIYRVTITMRDLEERNIDINAIDINSPQTIALFSELMEQVASQFGFNFSGTQLIIDPVPNIDNSFDITITKLDDSIDFESIHKYIRNRYRKTDIRVKKRTSNILTNIMAFSFESLEDVAHLSSAIFGIYCGSSTLYKMDSKYYLILSKNNIRISDERILESHLMEYGVKVANPTSFEGYLNEYGELMIEHNAVEILTGFGQ